MEKVHAPLDRDFASLRCSTLLTASGQDQSQWRKGALLDGDFALLCQLRAWPNGGDWGSHCLTGVCFSAPLVADFWPELEAVVKGRNACWQICLSVNSLGEKKHWGEGLEYEGEKIISLGSVADIIMLYHDYKNNLVVDFKRHCQSIQWLDLWGNCWICGIISLCLYDGIDKHPKKILEQQHIMACLICFCVTVTAERKKVISHKRLAVTNTYTGGYPESVAFRWLGCLGLPVDHCF